MIQLWLISAAAGGGRIPYFRRALRNLKGKVAKVIGLDGDIVAKDNPPLMNSTGSRRPLRGL